MATPTLAQSHYDEILTNISVAFMQQSKLYIANKVFPVVNVEKQSGKFFTYNQGDWLRDEAAKRADATESVGSGYTLGQDSYDADVWAFHKDVGDQVVANATNPISPMRDAANFVASRLLMRQEVDWADSFFKAGVWTYNWTGVASGAGANQFDQFDDYVNSTPIDTIDGAKELVAGATGFEVNTMVVGKAVYNKLKNHPQIIDRIKYTSSSVITEQLLAQYFGVDNFYVARTLINTAKEGQTDAVSYLQNSKGILLTHSAPSPGLLTPSAGYTFSWNGITGASGLDIGTYSMRMELAMATRVESQAAWDNKVVAPNLGVFLAAAVA